MVAELVELVKPAMSGAAAGAGAQDPSRELKTPQDRQGLFKLEPERFAELCGKAYLDGDYSYVNIALTANHEAMKEFIEKSTASATRAVTTEESYDLILMTQNMNSLLKKVEAEKVRSRT